MSSHEDCTADNVDEPIDTILDLPDVFEAEMLPVDSQVRSVIVDEPDGESGVAGRPDRPDLQPVPDSDVISSDEDWERQIFSAQLSNRGTVHPFEDSFHQDAERSFQHVTPLEESFIEDVVEGIIEDESYSIIPLSPMQVGEGTADTVHSKRYY